MTRKFSGSPRLGVLAGLSLFGVGCQGPLPPENPKTQIDQRAEVIPIIVDSREESKDGEPSIQDPKTLTWRNIGLETPESVLHEPNADVYLVSNIQGSPTGVDNDGFIAVLKPDGGVENLKLIEGGKADVTLNAPKGMALADGKLWVTDIDHVRCFDLATSKPEAAIKIEGATFLNDIAVARDGSLYVTDSGLTAGNAGLEPTKTDAIYRLESDEVTVVVKTTLLNRPNGIAFLGEQMLVVPFGGRQLRALDASGKEQRAVELPAGSLDGLVVLGDDDFLVASWETGSVYRGGFSRPFEAMVSGVSSPADIGYDAKRQRVLVPLFELDEVRAVPVLAAEGSAAPIARTFE